MKLVVWSHPMRAPMLAIALAWPVIGGVSQPSGPSSESIHNDVQTAWNRYVAGDYDRAVEELGRVSDWARFERDVRSFASAWPAHSGAAFILEAAAAEQRTAQHELPAAKAFRQPLLSIGFRHLTTKGASGEFVSVWFRAASSLVQGRGAELPVAFLFEEISRVFEPLARRLADPPDAQLSLALLKSREVHHDFAEGWFSIGGRAFNRRLGRINSDPSPVYGGLIGAIRRFEALLGSPTIRAEALLQLGFFKMLDDKPQEATRFLEQAGALTTDRWVAYNAALLRGRIAIQSREHRRAQTAWVEALQLYPDAPAAARALAALLYITGDRTASRRLNDQIVAARDRSDPWDEFAFGEYRQWSDRLAAMRALLR